jgi:methylenetetrahydrofolate reductase (NADPH)
VTRISALLDEGFCLSVELWPPRSDVSTRRLEESLRRLGALDLAFASITYGAGGSTRERTHDLVVSLEKAGNLVPMAHLACAAHRRDELVAILERYRAAGIENILALRGDPPLAADAPLPAGELAHAEELVELARGVGPFCVAVAAHPEGHPDTPDRATERRHLAHKLALADFAITQFFFEVADYLRLVDEMQSLGVDRPVIPGVMPITRYRTVAKMAELSGSAVPAWVVSRIERAGDDAEAVRSVGVEIASELGAKLLSEGVPGLHFYTMNEVNATLEVCANLGLGDRGAGAR